MSFQSSRLQTLIGLMLSVLIQSQVALAEEDPTPSKDWYNGLTIGINPLQLGMNLIPGQSAVGVDLEKSIDSHWSLSGNIHTYNSRILNSAIDKIQEDMNEDQKPIVKKYDSISLALGARYYGSTTEDSWYGGAALNFLRARMTWAYGNELLHERFDLVTPTIEGGYRWLWSSGYSVRLGAKVALASLGTTKRDRDSDSSAALEGEEKLKKRDVYGKNNFLANSRVSLDLSLGYTF